MMHARLIVIALVPGLLACGGCTTLQDVVAYGQGPFDRSPAQTSTAALDGLHESSWGNSGKWGGPAPGEGTGSEPGAETGAETGADPEPQPEDTGPPPPAGR